MIREPKTTWEKIHDWIWPGNLNVEYIGQLQSIPYCTNCEKRVEDVYHECPKHRVSK